MLKRAFSLTDVETLALLLVCVQLVVVYRDSVNGRLNHFRHFNLCFAFSCYSVDCIYLVAYGGINKEKCQYYKKR